MFNSTSYNDTIHNLCRCCMHQTRKTHQSSFDANLLDVYTKITSRKLQDWNNMPKIICQMCSTQLTTINDFIQKCVDADEKFNTLAQSVLSKENEIILNSLKVEGEVIELIEVHVLDDEELEINSADIKDEIDISVDDWIDAESFLVATEVKTTLNKTEEDKTLQENSFKRPQRTNKRKILNDEEEDPPKKSRYKNKRIHLPPVTCFTCKMKFKIGAPGKARQKLEKHYKTSEGCKPQEFKCPQCPRVYRNKSDFDTHMDVHSTDLKYKCKECELCFKQESSLIRHFQNKHCAKTDPVLCQFCPKKYNLLSSLTQHLHQSHQDKFNITCNLCQKKFLQKIGLQRHMRKIHPNEKPARNINTSCNLCGKHFLNDVGLQLHMRGKHKNGDSDRNVNADYDYSRLCNICGVKCNDLTTHLNKHQGIRPFECDQCPKNYFTKSELNLHKIIHLSTKAFKCSQCESAFYYKKALTRHLKTHSGNKPFKCPHCGKCFARRSNLIQHSRTHTGERPFECPYCDSTFKFQSTLCLHKKTHIKNDIVTDNQN